MKRIAVTKKKAIIGAIVALLILAGLGAVMVYIAYDLKEQARAPVETVPVEDVQEALNKFAKDGKADEGIAFVDAQIKAQKGQDEKQELLVQKSQFATKVGRTDIALDAAKKADDMDSGLASSLALAEAYERLGDEQQAITYYQRVVDGIEDDTFLSRYRYVWEDKIKELSS